MRRVLAILAMLAMASPVAAQYSDPRFMLLEAELPPHGASLEVRSLGADLADHSGGDRTPTIYGGVSVSNALVFPSYSSTNYATFDIIESSDPYDQTIMFWWTYDGNDWENKYLLDTRGTNSCGFSICQYYGYFDAARRFGPSAYRGRRLVFADALTVIAWYHVAIVHTVSDIGSTDDYVVYLNGEVAETIPLSTGTPAEWGTEGGTAYIGRPPSGAAGFHGRINNILIYRRALGSEEIKREFLRGPPQ